MADDPVRWTTAAWRSEATAWLDDCLDDHGARRTGPVEQPHRQPWATALTAPTTQGRVWLKASAEGTAFEMPLYRLLVRVTPEHVLHPLAIDVERSWLLLPDGGIPIRERLTGEARTKATIAAVSQYAVLQRTMAPYVDEVLACGVPDRRPAVMADRFDDAVAFAGDQIDPRVALLRDQVVDWCRRLAVAPGRPSLDHSDLHGWNILGGVGTIKFYDWGDAAVSHPFASLLVPLEFAEPADRPAIRDAFLDQYRDLAPHAELVEAATLACRLGQITRTLAWQQALGGADPGPWDEETRGYLNSLIAHT